MLTVARHLWLKFNEEPSIPKTRLKTFIKPEDTITAACIASAGAQFSIPVKFKDVCQVLSIDPEPEQATYIVAKITVFAKGKDWRKLAGRRIDEREQVKKAFGRQEEETESINDAVASLGSW